MSEVIEEAVLNVTEDCLKRCLCLHRCYNNDELCSMTIFDSQSYVRLRFEMLLMFRSRAMWMSCEYIILVVEVLFVHKILIRKDSHFGGDEPACQPLGPSRIGIYLVALENISN